MEFQLYKDIQLVERCNDCRRSIMIFGSIFYEVEKIAHVLTETSANRCIHKRAVLFCVAASFRKSPLLSVSSIHISNSKTAVFWDA